MAAPAWETVAVFEDRESAIYSATLALGIGRYADAVVAMRHVALMDAQELTPQERNMLQESYRNMVEDIGRDILALSHRRLEEEGGGGNVVIIGWINDYIQRLISLMVQAANDAKDIIYDSLIARTESPETRVFYYKMVGDLYRHCAMLTDHNLRMELGSQAMRAYERGRILALARLESCNLIRLSLALSYATFHHDVMNSTHIAIRMLGESTLLALQNPSLRDDISALVFVGNLNDQVLRWTREIVGGQNVNNGGGEGVEDNGGVNNRINDNGGGEGVEDNGGVNNRINDNGGGEGVEDNGGVNNRINDNGGGEGVEDNGGVNNRINDNGGGDGVNDNGVI